MITERRVEGDDPRQLRVALRSDLKISIQSFQDGVCYLLEDPVENRVFQVGIPEGTFLFYLDGTRTLDSAIRQATAALGNHAFSEQEAIAIVRWLTDARLVRMAGSSGNSAAWLEVEPPTARRPFDPLAIRIPLVRPDALLQILLPVFGWLFAKPMFFVWCLLSVAASWRMIVHWESFTQAALATLVPGQWWSLMAVCLLLKVLHETAHGLVCRRYGGSVSEAGIMLLWGLPVPYVDVTSSWAFRSKLARIHTAAAGIYIETLVAAVAGLVWQPMHADLFNQMCVQFMIIAIASSLVFNANPLMRFDGYYILMDTLGVPNLASWGHRSWAAKARQYFYGIPAVLPNRTRWQRHLVLGYGLLSFLWRYLVYFTLAILMAAILHIDERHVPLVALLLMATFITLQRRRRLSAGGLSARPAIVRVVVTGVALGTSAWLGLFYLSCPRSMTAPGVVEYAPLHSVRTSGPGFVQEVHVRSGDVVQRGDVVVVLANPELETELADLELAIEQSSLTLRTLQKQGAAAAHTAELQNLDGLRQQYLEKKVPVEQLILRAPATGTIVSRLPELALGTYLESGTEVVIIGDQAKKELHVSIPQDDVHWFTDAVGNDTRVRVGNDEFIGRLSRISPRADVTPVHSALYATEGGPLAVRFTVSTEAGTASQQPSLHMPHFTGHIELPAGPATRLGAGQRGQIAINVVNQPLGTQLLHSVSRWCRDKVRHVRGG